MAKYALRGIIFLNTALPCILQDVIIRLNFELILNFYLQSFFFAQKLPLAFRSLIKIPPAMKTGCRENQIKKNRVWVHANVPVGLYFSALDHA